VPPGDVIIISRQPSIEPDFLVVDFAIFTRTFDDRQMSAATLLRFTISSDAFAFLSLRIFWLMAIDISYYAFTLGFTRFQPVSLPYATIFASRLIDSRRSFID